MKENRRDIITDSLLVVCDMLDVTQDEMKSKSRKREFVMARALFFKLVRELAAPKVSLKYIGEYVSQRDHTTVIHNLNVLENRMKQFPELRQVYVFLKCKVSREFPMHTLTKSEIKEILLPILHEINSEQQRSKYAPVKGTLSEVRKTRKEDKIKEIERQREFDAEEEKIQHLPDQHYSYKSRHS